ncbi:hypothetical protein [Streptomyces misionensis]|uniref:hypothetical protein n=1 Tax=Streptomyces misionensis TaxID=67331 RepID=UPI0033ABC8F4
MPKTQATRTAGGQPFPVHTVGDDGGFLLAVESQGKPDQGEGPARDYWRKLMDAYTPVFPGGGSVMEEAWRKVHADGEAKGEMRGEAKGEAKAVLRVLRARGVEVSESVRERVMACADLDVLETWLDRSLSVASAEELFVGEQGARGVQEEGRPVVTGRPSSS